MSGTWTLVGADGRRHESAVPGTLGGHRRSRIYGRLDCPAARRAIERGGYVGSRVFFLEAADAVAAGYRPCAICLPERYREWKDGAAEKSPRDLTDHLAAPSQGHDRTPEVPTHP